MDGFVATSDGVADLAARTISETDNPLWSGMARTVFAGVIRRLRAEYGSAWGWPEIREVADLDAAELAAFLGPHEPEAAGLINPPGAPMTGVCLEIVREGVGRMGAGLGYEQQH